MCRVNLKKIRQPKGFKDCWILNSSPYEIRPYRILIKKIFQSALAGGSQYEIKTFMSTPSNIKDIIAKKDKSFYITNKIKFSNDDYVIHLYTKPNFVELNYYLREGKLLQDYHFTEKQLKSWVWCLHCALE